MAFFKPKEFLKFKKILTTTFINKFVDNGTSICFETNFKGKLNNHIYMRNILKSDAVNYIVDSTVFKNDDIIVTSKPYAVSRRKSISKLDNISPTSCNINMEDILPEVAERFGYNSLKIIKLPEKFASGVMILAITEEGEEQIIKSWKLARGRQSKLYSYIVITHNKPVKADETTKFGIVTQKRNDEVIPTVVQKWSKNSVKRKETILVNWQHRTLSESKLASLVKVELSNICKNSLKLYLATGCFSPVLGDHLFSCRVLDFMGVPLLVNPAECKNASMKLNPELLTALQIQLDDYCVIPSHVHLHSITLPITRKSTMTFTVPPPETFMWSCQKLGLDLHSLSHSKEESARTSKNS